MKRKTGRIMSNLNSKTIGNSNKKKTQIKKKTEWCFKMRTHSMISLWKTTLMTLGIFRQRRNWPRCLEKPSEFATIPTHPSDTLLSASTIAFLILE